MLRIRYILRLPPSFCLRTYFHPSVISRSGRRHCPNSAATSDSLRSAALQSKRLRHDKHHRIRPTKKFRTQPVRIQYRNHIWQGLKPPKKRRNYLHYSLIETLSALESEVTLTRKKTCNLLEMMIRKYSRDGRVENTFCSTNVVGRLGGFVRARGLDIAKIRSERPLGGTVRFLRSARFDAGKGYHTRL